MHEVQPHEGRVGGDVLGALPKETGKNDAQEGGRQPDSAPFCQDAQSNPLQTILPFVQRSSGKQEAP